MRTGRLLVTLGVLLCLTVAMGFASGQVQGASRPEPVVVSLYMWIATNVGLTDQKSVEEAIAQYTIPKINASLDVQWISQTDWYDKKRLMIASGEPFDICFTAPWNNFDDEVARNAWRPLDELIDKYAPELREVEGEDLLRAATVNGKIVALPQANKAADGISFLGKKKYVDKYQIPMEKIKTLDDIEAWLPKIKAGDPDVAGWLLQDHLYNMPAITFRDMENVYDFDFWLDRKDGKIKNMYNFPQMWPEMERMHRWYKAGYFQKDLEDMLAKKDGPSRRKTTDWVFTYGGVGPGADLRGEARFGVPVVTSGPLFQPIVCRSMLMGNLMAISQTSTHPVESIKMLALLSTDKYLNNLVNFGIEGKHWDFVDKQKGIIHLIPDTGYAPNMTGQMPNQLLNYLTDKQPPNQREASAAFIKTARVGEALGFAPNVVPIKTEIAAYSAVIEAYGGPYYNCIIDPATFKDEMMAKLKAAGLDVIEAELNRQYQVYKAGK
jgi:putative aldouronate transport system substrate-binding protein